MLLALPKWFQCLGQGDGSDQCLEPVDVRTRHVGHHKGTRPSSPTSQQGPVQRLLVRLSHMPGGFSQFTHQAAQFVGRRSGGLGKAERNGYGIGYPLGPFAYEAAASKAEDAAPDTVEMDGDDWYSAAFHDPFESATEWQQCAGS